MLELARFRVDPAAEAAFLAARPAMVEAVLEHVPGIKAISLVRLDDGTWIDIVTWADREAAEAGAKVAAGLPGAKRWLDAIDVDLSMEFGEVVDLAER